MTDRNTNQQFQYLKEAALCLQRADFHTEPILGSVLPVTLEGQSLGCVTNKGSALIHRDNIGNEEAENAVHRMADIAARTLEYMTAMETAPQLKASGLEGDYRILADFNGTVLAGHPTERGVQFITWDWDWGHKGVSHGHYFMENYDAAKRDFAIRSGLISEVQLFSPEQLTEIYRCCADSVEGDLYDLPAEVEATIRGVQDQIRKCLPNLDNLIQQEIEKQTQGMTM